MAYKKMAGKIITFYSYKGGTGRTMALANTACILAKKEKPSKSILAIDWDLEAPGLHHYFRDLILAAKKNDRNDRTEFNLKPGLIEMMSAISASLKSSISNPLLDQDIAVELIRSINPKAYITKTKVDNLFILKAGVFDSGYPDRVNTFDWERLFKLCPILFSSLAEYFSETFRYVLIDSRTGHTDTGNICTTLMPERLVTVFTPNRQSLSGIPNLVKEAMRYRRESEDIRPLIIFPLPSRIENAEPKMKYAWRHGDHEENILGYQPLFEQLFKESYELHKCDLNSYFDEIQIQHVPRFSYGEVVSALTQSGSERLSLTRSYESFCDKLTSKDLPWEEPTIEADRLKKSVLKLTDTLENQLKRYIKKGEYGEALEVITRLVEIGREESENTGDFSRLAGYLRALSDVQFRLNHINKAVSSAKESYIYHRTHGDQSGLAAAINWLGFMSRHSPTIWPPP